MVSDLKELKEFLRLEFNRRIGQNSAYSQRAFSRDLGISQTTLNDFIKGKRSLSYGNIDKVFSYVNSRVRCSWCTEPRGKESRLIGGPKNLYICEKCVSKCSEILEGNIPIAAS